LATSRRQLFYLGRPTRKRVDNFLSESESARMAKMLHFQPIVMQGLCWKFAPSIILFK